MATGELTQTDRFVNTLLLGLLVFLALSGVVMLYGDWLPWLFDLHRMAALSMVALLPWKGVTIYRSLLRGMERTFDRSLILFMSLVFTHLILLVILLAFLWLWRIGPYSSLFQPLIAWHWILGLAALPLLAFHAWRRWPGPRKQDFMSRRSFLKLLGLAGAGVAAGGLVTLLAQARAEPEMPRRFTGSRGSGFFSGNDFPITGEPTQTLDVNEWRLRVTGAVSRPLSLAYEELLARTPQTLTEVIDCTSGWYSLQDWLGVPLIDLLEEAGLEARAAGVRLVSSTDYNHTYPMQEARKILLATHVSGEVLAPRHGFPLRAVVPGRRGWFWVKWLVKIEVLDSAWQVIGGILWSPRQVIRQW